MKIINRTHLNDEIYQQFYNYHYHFDKESVKIRNGDAWPALCYAHGIFDLQHFDSLSDQINFVRTNKLRNPGTVLEIGSGNGEISFAFWHLGAETHSVDCNPSTALFFQKTASRFFGPSDDRHSLYLGKIGAFLDCIPESLDTVVLVETLEHILETEWQEFFNTIKPVLEKNHGYLVICNTIWPLGGENDPAHEHISRIDDDFFNALIMQGGLILYRNLGNICIRY